MRRWSRGGEWTTLKDDRAEDASIRGREAEQEGMNVVTGDVAVVARRHKRKDMVNTKIWQSEGANRQVYRSAMGGDRCIHRHIMNNNLFKMAIHNKSASTGHVAVVVKNKCSISQYSALMA